MKRWSRFLMILTVLAGPPQGAQAAGTRVPPEHLVLTGAVAEYSRYPTLSAFLKSLSGRIDENLREFIAQKAETLGGLSSPRVSADPTGGLSVEVAPGQAIHLEAVSWAAGKFTLNNAAFTLDPQASPEAIWNRVTECLPTRVSSNWLEPLIPSAHAALPALIAAGTAVIGLASYVMNSIHCAGVSKSTATCLDASSILWNAVTISTYSKQPIDPATRKIVGEVLTGARRTRDSLFTKGAIGCGEEKRRLSVCIQHLENDAKARIPGFDPGRGSDDGSPPGGAPATSSSRAR